MLNFEICVLVFGVFAFVTTVSFKRFISSVVCSGCIQAFFKRPVSTRMHCGEVTILYAFCITEKESLTCV